MNNKHQQKGFTLTETTITVAIIGILSSIALPNYTQSVCRSNQAEAISELTMLQTTAMSYKDEFGNQPENWEQMNAIAPTQTLTSDGSKNKASGVLKGTTQKLRSGKYEITTESTNETLTFTAEPTKGCEPYNAQACINTKNGESDIETGNQMTSAATTTC
jgi:prepilin-type N-terminal cleavage/methylation domain-containing protein